VSQEINQELKTYSQTQENYNWNISVVIKLLRSINVFSYGISNQGGQGMGIETAGG
jgi:hypothetical protein